MTCPTLSICIPAYKTPEILLRRAIDNLLEQTFQNFEIIIVNDGADEKVKNIIFSYNKKFTVDNIDNLNAKIRYTETANAHGGGAFASNVALKNTQGKYVFFHDHDDYLCFPQDDKLSLELMLSEIEDSDNDILIFNYLFQNRNKIENIPFKPVNLNKTSISSNDIVELEKYFLQPFYGIWNKLFRREFLINNNLFFNDDLLHTEDDEFFFRYMFATDKIIFSNNYYYCWNNNHTSISTKIRTDGYTNFKLLKYMKDTLVHYNIYNETKFFFLNWAFRMLHPVFPPAAILNINNPIEVKNAIREYISELDIKNEDIISLRNYKYLTQENIYDILFYI